jgi:sister chromatid cohesion protein PDS5
LTVVAEALASKLFDPDDKVRTAVCRIYGQLDYETALHHVSEGHLRTVVGRGLDKKVGEVVASNYCLLTRHGSL